ncbi:MAG: peptidylprolyl isomerase [Ignavibacteria bacterium]|jgi:peptidyl-prolyl cis-trans isomerase SurA|nr:peptidylprolyl isomerase [Ignavibacteria bacterium]MDH7526700.1 peptidylprolyl isomerase [Ignavibacteria bacterium]
MNQIRKIFFVFLIISINGFAQEVLDKVVAVVDNQYILLSELDFQTQIIAYQRKLNPNDPNLKKAVLNSLIEEKLMLVQAELDSIRVTEDEVNRQLDFQIENFIQQFGSKEKLEQAYNRPLEKIKRELRDEIRNNILIQKVQDQKFARLEVSRFEVEKFFEQYKDSIGLVPEEVQLSQIFIQAKLSDYDKEVLRKKLQAILDSIKNGGDFAEFAKRYSEDQATAKQGGDLGFVRRGLFFKEFEEVVFTLKEGEISDIIETPVGFHIAQLVERRGETVRVRHILLKLQPSAESEQKIIGFLSAIRDSILSGKNSFAYYARLYSEDKATAQFGGEMGKVPVAELDPDLRNLISKMKNGDVSQPRKLTVSKDMYGYQLILLEKRIPEHYPDINLDYDKIAQLALLQKKQKVYRDLIEQLKKQVYWEIRL